MNVIEKVFGTHSERELKMIRPIVAKIESMRTDMMAKSDEELRDQTRILKERLAGGETLDDILPEAFATVREAAKRTLNMEHFPDRKSTRLNSSHSRASRMPSSA